MVFLTTSNIYFCLRKEEAPPPSFPGSLQYAGHSFRIGAATSVELAGVEDSSIQALGRCGTVPLSCSI